MWHTRYSPGERCDGYIVGVLFRMTPGVRSRSRSENAVLFLLLDIQNKQRNKQAWSYFCCFHKKETWRFTFDIKVDLTPWMFYLHTPSQFWSLKMAFFPPSVMCNSSLLCKRKFSSPWGSPSTSRNAWRAIKWFPGLEGLNLWLGSRAWPGMFIVLWEMTVKRKGLKVPALSFHFLPRLHSDGAVSSGNDQAWFLPSVRPRWGDFFLCDISIILSDWRWSSVRTCNYCNFLFPL